MSDVSQASWSFETFDESVQKERIVAEILAPEMKVNSALAAEDGRDGDVEQFDPRTLNLEASAGGGVRRNLRSSGNCEQTGIASCYGDRFQGRSTVNGECFNMNSFFAADKTLPMGIRVWVLNLRTGLAVVAWINDDGRHVRGRIIDLSIKAKEAIGMNDLDKVELTCML